MRDTSKRRNIFNLLKNQKYHIILLQETHSSPEIEKVWSNEWGNRIIYAHGTHKSKGVAILILKNFPAEIESVRLDPSGRFLIIDLKIQEYNFVLVNIYAPNEDDPNFFISLFQMIDARNNDSVLLAGDFNTTLDEALDLYNNSGNNHVKKRSILLEYMDKKELYDIWRIKNPTETRYTWRKPNTLQPVMSRLDYFILSQDLALRCD